MVNITIYPYGNANERQSGGSWVFSCQHGEGECEGNMVETCFVNLVNFDQDKFMPFIIDYETELSQNSRDPFGTATTLLNTGKYAVTTSQMNACTDNSGNGSSQGNAWEHQMALWTNAANHQYTPWITLNGKHNDLIQNECTASSLKCTCNAYSGTNACCNQLNEKPVYDVCYKDGNQ